MRPVARAWRELRTQSLRYGLAGLSMLIGVLGISSIAIVNSVALDMLVAQQEQLHGREASYAANFAVTPAQLNGDLDPVNSLAGLHDDLISRFASDSISIAIQADRTMALESPSQHAANEPGDSLLVKWTDGSIGELQRLPVIDGTLPSGIYPPGLALNESAASAIGYPDVQQAFLLSSIDSQPLSVVITGVVGDGLTEPTAYGDMDLALQFFPLTLADESMTLRMQGVALQESDAGRVVAQLTPHGFSAPEGAQRVDTVESVRAQVGFLRLVFGGCALAILVIAAIGTANVGLSSVSERARELVVRRALGARRRDIFAQLISGAVAVGVLISLIAVSLTVAAVYLLVPQLIPAASSVTSPQFPLDACVAGIVAAMGTAVLGGLLPAIKATRLPVGLALRE